MTTNGTTNGNGAAVNRITEAQLDAFLRRQGIGTFDDDGTWHPPGTNGHRKQASTSQQPNSSDVIRRARAYLAKLPPGISGQGGHCATFRAACELVLGFGLSVGEALPVLEEYNRTCQPEWSERELLHKLRDADKKTGPRGYRLTWRTESPTHQQTTYTQPESFRRLDEIKTDEFPIDVFPGPLQTYAMSIARMIGCPVDFPACAMLVVAATCLGNSRAIALKRRWVESARFYMAIVADPSEGKSPALDPVCRPIRQLQLKCEQEYERDMVAHEESTGAIDSWKRGQRRKGTPYVSPPEHADKPTFRHWFTTNSTVEKLGVMLKENPRGLVMIQDELVSWITGLNQYKAGGKGNDRQFFLSAWSGSHVKVDRKSDDGSISVPSPFLNVLGGIQPDMLNSICDEKGRRDGFVERILFSFPEPLPYAKWNDADVDEQAEAVWIRVCDQLASLQMQSRDDGRQRPELVHLAPEAKARWVEWFDAHADDATDRDDLKGTWAKYKSHTARLALTIHFLRLAYGEIASETVDPISVMSAVQLTEYFKTHAAKVHERMVGATSKRDFTTAIRWIEKRGGTVTVRDFQRSGPGHFRALGSSEILELFAQLADLGYGKLSGRTFTTVVATDLSQSVAN